MNKCLGPLLLCTAVLVSGCSQRYVAQKVTPSAYRPAPAVPSVPVQPAKAKVEIISDPAGARIEINDNYVGDTPITVELAQNDGQFTQFTVIRALPNEAGDYVQSKYFLFQPATDYGSGYRTAAKGDQIPSRILFDMHLGPVTPSVDVNVVPSN
jgi:hypothetical protein